MPKTQLSADEENGTLTASTGNFALKSGVDETGAERQYVEGFLATTHVDKGNDEFTEEALKQMADDINGEDIDAVFNDVDTEALREATIGNFDHANNPASPFGDTRIVPAFKIQEAKIRDTPDDETGLWIKAVLNTGGMLDETVSAVKNSIKDDYLNAFSIEFIPQKVRKLKRGDRVIRVIEKAAAKGAALTGRPMNPAASMTDAMLKSMATEYEELEVKQDYTIQTPDYTATSEASWSKPAMEDFPDDYDVMSIFLARNSESDDFSEQALPVVDYRNDEATLVLEALRSAHNLAPQVDGLSSDEVASARAKAEMLAEDEFDVMLEREGDSGHMDDEKNDITTMTEDEQPEPEEEGGEPESEGDEEVKSLSEDIKELKSEFEDVKEANKELRTENEDLKSELEDLKTLESVKNDLEEVKGLVEDIELEDGPRVEQDQKRDTDSDEKPRWQKTIDGMKNPSKFLEGEGKSRSMLDSFVEGKTVSKEEVKNYVNKD